MPQSLHYSIITILRSIRNTKTMRFVTPHRFDVCPQSACVSSKCTRTFFSLSRVRNFVCLGGVGGLVGGGGAWRREGEEEGLFTAWL
jgi:hypothetical protein